MKWEEGRRSKNVEDRRGMTAKKGLAIGGGVTGIIVALIVVFMGGDPQSVVKSGGSEGAPEERSEEENELADFVSVVLADTEDTWNPLFEEMGDEYEEPTLVLFTDAVNSACGYQSAAVGPFYCPGDNKVYIDLSFYADLRKKLGAPGDFAQAYVIAHEVGHHVQNLTGTSAEVHAKRQKVSKEEANKLSVRQELQADCYAGIWAHHADKARDILETGDVEEGLNAASAIGDDRLQRQSKGYVTPESFTHGTSAQRVKWFKVGLEHGKFEKCDTFAVSESQL